MFPVLCRKQLTQEFYTTQLQAGLGLDEETIRLVSLWEPGMTGQCLLRCALEAGAFPNLSARRLRNIVIEAFSPRYLIQGGLPAQILKTLTDRVPKTDLRQVMYLYTCRANLILADFVRQVYWPAYAAGRSAVTKDETRDFIRVAISRGYTRTQWAPSTVVRISNYLLGTCTDYGLLGFARRNGRSIAPFRISPFLVSFLVYDLHFNGLGDSALVHHKDWQLFGLDTKDVMDELKRIALRGEIILQSAGSSARIGWKHKSMMEWVNVHAES